MALTFKEQKADCGHNDWEPIKGHQSLYWGVWHKCNTCNLHRRVVTLGYKTPETEFIKLEAEF